MNKQDATKAKAEWLVKCLEFGWTKKDLDRLSAIWDEHKDEYGNLRPPPPEGNTPASEGYWVEIPITKLPEKDGWYVLVAHGAIELVRWYDSVNGWDIPEAEYGYKHYLIRSQSPPSLPEAEKANELVEQKDKEILGLKKEIERWILYKQNIDQALNSGDGSYRP